MTQYDHEAAVAVFIRAKGLTRCPTACVAPTQGLPNAVDQAALEKHAAALEQHAAPRNQFLFTKMAGRQSMTTAARRNGHPPRFDADQLIANLK
jgi:hypothetical protein